MIMRNNFDYAQHTDVVFQMQMMMMQCVCKMNFPLNVFKVACGKMRMSASLLNDNFLLDTNKMPHALSSPSLSSLMQIRFECNTSARQYHCLACCWQMQKTESEMQERSKSEIQREQFHILFLYF